MKRRNFLKTIGTIGLGLLGFTLPPSPERILQIPETEIEEIKKIIYLNNNEIDKIMGSSNISNKQQRIKSVYEATTDKLYKMYNNLIDPNKSIIENIRLICSTITEENFFFVYPRPIYTQPAQGEIGIYFLYGDIRKKETIRPKNYIPDAIKSNKVNTGFTTLLDKYKQQLERDVQIYFILNPPTIIKNNGGLTLRDLDIIIMNDQNISEYPKEIQDKIREVIKLNEIGNIIGYIIAKEELNTNEGFLAWEELISDIIMMLYSIDKSIQNKDIDYMNTAFTILINNWQRSYDYESAFKYSLIKSVEIATILKHIGLDPEMEFSQKSLKIFIKAIQDKIPIKNVEYIYNIYAEILNRSLEILKERKDELGV